MFSSDKTSLYFAAMLKAHGVKKIIACPGACNASLNHALQSDSFFDCYSFYDERSAAYAACGMAESGHPVCVTSTGATASRNFIPALTEAYYRNLPVIVGAFLANQSPWSLQPQNLDHRVTQNDIKRFSAALPNIVSDFYKKRFISAFNAGMCELAINGGPILFFAHQLVPYAFNTPAMPEDCWVTRVEQKTDNALAEYILKCQTAIFIGEHPPFSKSCQESISRFAQLFNIPIYVDHYSNYHGENAILLSRALEMRDFKYFPDLVIDLGGITGNYNYFELFKRSAIWRISPRGEYIDRAERPVLKLFVCQEETFFSSFKNCAVAQNVNSSLPELKKECEELIIPDLPLGAGLVARELAANIPENSILHLGILNSLRNMGFFKLPPSVEVFANVGGFGIDGIVSTLLGHSLACPDKICIGILGDLAFFYDMNALGNRQLGNNFRLLLINNGNGEEMAINPSLTCLGEAVLPFISAGGHNQSGGKAWAEACGLKYLYASTSTDLKKNMRIFCDRKCNKPILFEVITKPEDEKECLRLIRRANKGMEPSFIKPSMCGDRTETSLPMPKAKILNKIYTTIKNLGR